MNSSFEQIQKNVIGQSRRWRSRLPIALILEADRVSVERAKLLDFADGVKGVGFVSITSPDEIPQFPSNGFDVAILILGTHGRNGLPAFGAAQKEALQTDGAGSSGALAIPKWTYGQFMRRQAKLFDGLAGTSHQGRGQEIFRAFSGHSINLQKGYLLEM